MTAVSRIPAAIDRLVSTWTVALAADIASGDTEVVDGPVIEDEFTVRRRIWVGYDGDTGGDMKAADSEQEWAGIIGAKRRDEKITVTCCAVALVGDDGVKAARDLVFDTVGDLETSLRSDPSIGLSPPTTAGIVNPQHYMDDGKWGRQARVVFDVVIATRI